MAKGKPTTKEIRKINPFPGFRPFRPEESDVFFGREKESMEVMNKLLINRFITVIGASGIGKSSLIYCGVLPKIRDLALSESSLWRIISFSPGNEPLNSLGKSIAQHITESGLEKVGMDNLLLEMHLNSNGIAEALKKHLIKSNEKVLLVIDQLEELFRYSKLSPGGTNGKQTAEFIEKLVKTISEADSGIFVIIAIRSDFIGECAHYQGLTQLISNSNYIVPHMSREKYRQAIEGPVKYAGATIEPALVDTILEDIDERTDLMPVFQHALMRTWDYWQEHDEPDRPLSVADYSAMGTMSDAISRHANEVYGELDPHGKEICEKMFKSITEKSIDNKEVRNPASVKTIRSVVQCTYEDLFDVIEKFRIPSRSFITPGNDFPLNEDSIIDISHESLMKLWDRLRGWVEDEAASVKMYLRLSEASKMYQQGKTSLWRPPDLQQAINWRDQHKPTLTWAGRYNPAFERAMVFLRTSEKTFLDEEEDKIHKHKIQKRRSRIVRILLGIAAIISIGFMSFAFVQKIAAERQIVLAEHRRVKAEEEKSKADSATIRAILKQQMADSNFVIAQQNEASALLQREEALIEQNKAERDAAEAKSREEIALIRSDSARRASIRADKEIVIATEQKNDAIRLRMISIAKSMSVRSIQFLGQRDLQTLLAYQAYLFNRKNNGAENDADIYNGLYNVARQYGNTNLKTFNGHKGGIKSIAFVPGKKEFYTSGNDGQVLRWSTEGQNQTYQVIYSGADIIEVLTVSPDASWLACGSDNSSIRMIPLKGNNMQYELTDHKGRINSLIFSYDGKSLYSASLDGKVLQWDLTTRTSRDLTTGEMQITSIDISSNGKYLAGINTAGSVIVWNPENKSDVFNIETAGKNIKVIRFKPDENILALGDGNGNIELWDISTRRMISEVSAHTAQVNDIQFNPSLKQMATASNDKTLKIFDISNNNDLSEPPVILSDNEGFVVVMEFSPDGQLIVSGTYEGTKNLLSRPAHVDNMVNDICTLVARNMTKDEWNAYVGRDIPFESTCAGRSYNIKVNVIR